jgi:hypothetical protein
MKFMHHSASRYGLHVARCDMMHDVHLFYILDVIRLQGMSQNMSRKHEQGSAMTVRSDLC